jgi:hypothetical protein
MNRLFNRWLFCGSWWSCLLIQFQSYSCVCPEIFWKKYQYFRFHTQNVLHKPDRAEWTSISIVPDCWLRWQEKWGLRDCLSWAALNTCSSMWAEVNFTAFAPEQNQNEHHIISMKYFSPQTMCLFTGTFEVR